MLLAPLILAPRSRFFFFETKFLRSWSMLWYISTVWSQPISNILQQYFPDFCHNQWKWEDGKYPFMCFIYRKRNSKELTMEQLLRQLLAHFLSKQNVAFSKRINLPHLLFEASKELLQHRCILIPNPESNSCISFQIDQHSSSSLPFPP